MSCCNLNKSFHWKHQYFWRYIWKFKERYNSNWIKGQQKYGVLSALWLIYVHFVHTGHENIRNINYYFSIFLLENWKTLAISCSECYLCRSGNCLEVLRMHSYFLAGYLADHDSTLQITSTIINNLRSWDC